MEKLTKTEANLEIQKQHNDHLYDVRMYCVQVINM